MAGMLDVLGVLLSGGNAFLQNQAVEKANRQNQQSVARANLMNAFGGNAMAQRVDPTLGTLGKIGMAAEAGLGAYQDIQDRDIEREQRQAAIDASKASTESSLAATARTGMESDITRGRLAAEAGGIPTLHSAPGLSIGEGGTDAGPIDFGAAPAPMEPGQSDVYRDAFLGKRASMEQDARTTAFNQEQEERRTVATEEQVELARRRVEAQQRSAEADVLRAEAQAMKNASDLVIRERSALISADRSLETLPEVASSYMRVKQLADFILDPKNRGKTAAQKNALIDIFQRGFIDVGVAVRQDDVQRILKTQGVWDRVMTALTRVESGDPIGDEQVRQISEAADLLYGAIGESVRQASEIRLKNSELESVADRKKVMDYVMASFTAVPVGDTPESLSEAEAEYLMREWYKQNPGVEPPAGDGMDDTANAAMEALEITEPKKGRRRGGTGGSTSGTGFLGMIGLANSRFGGQRGPNQDRPSYGASGGTMLAGSPTLYNRSM